ncbi:MAG: site-specific integrase, partial [Tannerella sp.]|nr:site-specific integrase [Tannerella sp.]
MKPTDFSKKLTDFLSLYLPGERGASRNTVNAYKDTFILFLKFMQEKKAINANKLILNDIKQEYVIEFLDWIQNERLCSNSTRNARLAAIHAFFRYLQYRNPINLHEWQKILSIPFKRVEKPVVSYLNLDGIKLLLEQPCQSTPKGKRDLALLSLLYDSGARVQEIIDLTPSSIILNKPYTVKLSGKGNKSRIVPLMENQIKILADYMESCKLTEPYAGKYPLFFNGRREKFSRMGITLILKKYADKARSIDHSLMPQNITPHVLRHSKAMHLLQSGVNLIYIRDFLGHTSITTTEIYARMDSMFKREALEKVYVEVTNR